MDYIIMGKKHHSPENQAPEFKEMNPTFSNQALAFRF